MKSNKKSASKKSHSVRIPSQLDIRGKEWTVHYKWGLRNDKGELCDGLCVPSERKIFLAHGLGKDKEQIFFHEYIHAVMAEVGLYHTRLDPDIEETICHNLSVELISSYILRKRPTRK